MPVKQKTVAQGRKRNYTKERLAETPARKKARAARNKARRVLGLKVGDGKVAGHKKSASKGGSNNKTNLRVESQKSSNKQGGRLQPKAAKRRGGRR